MPTTQVGEFSLYYEDDDFSDPWIERDAVFIEHGFGRNSSFFRAWIPVLARHYRVIRMDLRGHGRSEDPGPDYRFTMEDLNSDFRGFLDSLQINKVHYIGESIGGFVGATSAARNPERFKSLTLISTPMRIPDNSHRLALSLGFSSWGDAILKLGMKQWWMIMRESTGELTGNAAMDQYFAEEFARTPAHIGYALTLFMDTPLNLGDVVSQITVPTLFLSASGGTKTPHEAQVEMARSMVHGRMKLYEGAKHSMYYLTPDPVVHDTLEFIRSIDRF